MRTHTLGFPRIGRRRELKQALEAYWQGRIGLDALRQRGAELRATHWQLQREAGIAVVPSNDFSFYDQVLDLSLLVGNVPARFEAAGDATEEELAFYLARGVGRAEWPQVPACEMTKWFDTNYHYLVPELTRETRFRLGSDKPFREFSEALALGIRSKPVLLGPLTYLKLGKAREVNALDLLDPLLEVYAQVLRRLAQLGAEWVQLDEPALALDLSDAERAALARAYARLAGSGPKLLVASYFGELRDNLDAFLRLPVQALHFDLCRAREESLRALARVPDRVQVSLGLVDGRSVWRNDLRTSVELLAEARRCVAPERLWIAPSCSLLHVPYSLREERALDPALRAGLAFAEEKLAEVRWLGAALDGRAEAALLQESDRAQAGLREHPQRHCAEVRARCAGLTDSSFRRRSPSAQRRTTQTATLNLPRFPTTTIGSFPQTAELRERRARWRRGELGTAEYESFLRERIAEAVRWQEDIGLDVLVHGEFERNDMVEYFGEQLEGFAFTAQGWVQSYGSRCVKPPLLYGDVRRPAPMTVRWSAYAQSCASRPVKGMLTGPVTLLQWSFVREDLPRSETARQLALALRDEVRDLEAAGLRVIQVDEPAIREGLPLRRADAPAYLHWAAAAFRLATAGVRDETQIHTHMCYSDFNDILDAVADLDADVISIEAARSDMALLDGLHDGRCAHDIGPGVWDIHSPRVPGVAEIADRLAAIRRVLPDERLWVNPDCGLKTRGWPEVRASLSNLVAAARRLREAAAPESG